MIERAQAAERVKLDSLTLGDHHGVAIQYFQNTPMLGRLLGEWGPRPIGCLFLLPLWNPVLVAEHIATLAALAEGTFIVQTGIGSGDLQFAAMDGDHSTRGTVLEQRLATVKALLAGEEVPTSAGPLTLGLRPAQTVEWWIGAGAATKAIERAARLGDAWYASPAANQPEAQRQLDIYLAACDRHGTQPRPILRRDVLVLSSPGQAAELGEQILSAGYRGMSADQVAIGTPSEVAENFRPLAEMGFTDIICRCMPVPQPQALETIEALAEVRSLLS